MMDTRRRFPSHATAACVIALVACGGSEGATNGGASSGAPPGSGGGGGTGGNPPGGESGSIGFETPAGPPPALAPQLLAATYVGGAGDQFLREVAFEGGRVVARGEGFSVSYALDGSDGQIAGDATTADTKSFEDKPPLPGDPGKAYAIAGTDLTLRVGYRQAGKNLQQPIFRVFRGEERLWALWGHAAQDVVDKSLGADGRCYQAWGMPDGHIGVQCWTDGGNSVLAKDPRDLNVPGFDPEWAKGAFQKSAGGMSSAYVLVDPRDGGRAVSGTFAASHVGKLTVDPWGRVYVARVASSRSGGGDPQNPFAQDASASSGLFVLDPTLKSALFNARIGGACQGGKQAFAAIALEGDKLALAGTTCATNLATKNAVQASSGGGQDGFFVLLKLW